MNSFNLTFAPNTATNGHETQQRHSQDFRSPPANSAMPVTHRNGAVPVPHNRVGNGGMGNMRGGDFGPRSPPNNKSTSHVPCKFYRQGACQAGKACPFLHSNEPTERAPCKYFTKGNCKFGAKCALAHILPDGRVVNKQGFGGGGHLNLGGRVNVQHHAEPPPGTSLLTMQAHMAPMQPANYAYGQMQEDPWSQPRQAANYEIPTIDTTFSSHPGSNYGSPPNDGGLLPISPAQKGRSVLDAPLPASFDSQGISHMARFGPLAASVPSRFGLGSSPPSSYPEKSIGDSPALRNLHNSAFGDDSRNGRNDLLGSSPPDSTDQQYGRRIMHSERFSSRSKNTLSTSLGARPPRTGFEDWDADGDGLIFPHEEEMLPSTLGELLTPQENMRRQSRDHGESFSGLGASPADSGSKVGSPSAASSSPSRFQSLFSRRPNEGGVESGSGPGGASAFGHVGSPLRNSSLHPGASPSIRATARPTSGDGSSFLASPPRQTSSMGLLAQQLQRTRINSRASDGSDHPGMGMRVLSAGSIGSSAGGRISVDRAVSSSSINRERIDEEQGLFSMEEEEEAERSKEKSKDEPTVGPLSSANQKRLSGGNDPWAAYSRSPPGLGPIGGQRASSGTVGSLGKSNRTWNTNA
ncbi:hypothetical protein BU16DRAFT_561373 [Lophium mytilinum]|uniref:C3H1-type domain-containing protein n=1 Tax=Lophium mytilinum TaxID=390894 RepID=A0A6A6QSE3_9PEZI|nr:hypothetical protein BU16DRAFT_561373 [Lophium mytilinum]